MITTARTDASSFSTDQSSVSAQVTPIKNSITSIVNSVTDVDSKLDTPLNGVEAAGSNGNIGLQAFYGVFIGFSFFALLGVLLTACCDKYGCRHLMYFSCVFLFIAGLVGFLIVTIISILLPPVTWGCSYFDTTLASEAGFTGTFLDIQQT